MAETSLVAALRQSADPKAVDEIEQLIEHGDDRDLNRINVLAFAAKHGLNTQEVIAAFLKAAQLGLFEMSWNVLCPSCGGVLDASDALKAVDRDRYHCAFCAAGYEPTLDDIVEVTFTVSPRVRRIAAHAPDELSPTEFYRQMFWSSGVDLPDNLEARIADLTLDLVELPAGEKAFLSLQLPHELVIIFDPVTHVTQFPCRIAQPCGVFPTSTRCTNFRNRRGRNIGRRRVSGEFEVTALVTSLPGRGRTSVPCVRLWPLRLIGRAAPASRARAARPDLGHRR
jgi:hypothetical protein